MKKVLASFLFVTYISIFPLKFAFAEELGNPVAGATDITSFVQDSFEAATLGTKVVFPYDSNNVYKIYCQTGFLTDINFEKGEKITFVGGGDTTRWIIEKGKVGKDAQAVEHLYIKPTQRGITTNLIINTTQRTYQINVISSSFYNPSVAWIVEDNLVRQQNLKKINNYLTFSSENLNFNYKFKNKNVSWAPERVFDDGKKTYIKMKKEIFSSDAPAFFVLGNKNQIILVNYRILNGYYIVDRLFDKAVLQVGKDKIEIKRKS